MKGPLIQSRAGRYTWLQVISLVLSAVAYLLGSLPTALALLAVGTIFGIAATVLRVRDAQRMGPQVARNRRKK